MRKISFIIITFFAIIGIVGWYILNFGGDNPPYTGEIPMAEQLQQEPATHAPPPIIEPPAEPPPEPEPVWEPIFCRCGLVVINYPEYTAEAPGLCKYDQLRQFLSLRDATPETPSGILFAETPEYFREWMRDNYPFLYAELIYIPRPSPTDLQLALFAHMAFFPFDFNAGEIPGSPRFTPMHYHPFVEFVMTTGPNIYGFTFAEEMAGWRLQQTHITPTTGFGITVFTNEFENVVILAIRGTYGDLGPGLMEQTGTWWCNIRSMSGYRHSHLNSLTVFLNRSASRNLFSDANIYITGHSLGGYLAYIATHQLVQMGYEENIQRVVAFSAPLFTADTVELVYALGPGMRSRMKHYYVPEDLISGAVGVYVERADYGVFTLINRLLSTMQYVRSIEVPPAIYSFSNVMITVESFIPLGMPDHFTELVWVLNGAMSQEALLLTNEFRSVIAHQAVPRTWHTPRPEPPEALDASPLQIIRNFSTAWLMETVEDMVQQIFDTDTHFMMNFYGHLAGGERP